MDRDGSGWLDPKKLQKALQFMYAEATHNTPQAQCDTVASSRERERERERGCSWSLFESRWTAYTCSDRFCTKHCIKYVLCCSLLFRGLYLTADQIEAVFTELDTQGVGRVTIAQYQERAVQQKMQ